MHDLEKFLNSFSLVHECYRAIEVQGQYNPHYDYFPKDYGVQRSWKIFTCLKGVRDDCGGGTHIARVRVGRSVFHEQRNPTLQVQPRDTRFRTAFPAARALPKRAVAHLPVVTDRIGRGHALVSLDARAGPVIVDWSASGA